MFSLFFVSISINLFATRFHIPFLSLDQLYICNLLDLQGFKMGSFFGNIEMAPPIEVFHMNRMYQEESSLLKVNLTVGSMIYFISRKSIFLFINILNLFGIIKFNRKFVFFLFFLIFSTSFDVSV